MSNQKFQSFIDLVTFDQNLIELEQKSTGIKKSIVSLNNDIASLQRTIDLKSEQKKELKKNLDAQELEIKDLYEKEQRQTKILEGLKSPKEYDAANKELEHIKINRDKQERRLMQLWNSYEVLKKELESLEPVTLENIKNIQLALDKEEKSLELVNNELQAHLAERKQKFAHVSADLISIYEHMRGKVLNPVVPVQQGSCSSCFYLISAKDLQDLYNQELIQCKDCYRFLYIE